MKKIMKFSFLLAFLFGVAGCAFLGTGHIEERELRAKYFNEHSRTIHFNGIDIHYRKEGFGEPVVLLHGVMSSLHTWDAWAEELKKNHTVYRIDMPGFGFSGFSEPQGLYSDNKIFALLHGLLEHMGLSDVHLVGNSLGGYIAWNYALMYPEQLKTLTVIDPASYPQKLPRILSMMSNPVVRPFSRLMVPKPIFNFGVNQVYANPDNIPEATKQRYFDLLMREGNKSNLLSILKTMRRNNVEPDLGDGIKHIKVPTLVMWGDHDDWIPVSMAYRWKEDLAAAQLIVYPDAGHVPMEEIPARTVADFQAFIAQSRD